VGASVPPLGLSNRALDQSKSPVLLSRAFRTDCRITVLSAVDEQTTQPEEKGFNHEHISISGEMSGLPYEAVLANSTLWPEVEKLYGHGYEVSPLPTCAQDST